MNHKGGGDSVGRSRGGVYGKVEEEKTLTDKERRRK